MPYEIATLSCSATVLREVSRHAAAWVADPSAGGSLLGLWRAEAGALGRLLILRGFDTAADMAQERRRTALSDNPFNGGHLLRGFSQEGYAPFPFLPPIGPQKLGPLYELRTYHLAPGTLSRVMAGWNAAMEPARDYTRHMVTIMYALDGAPRITHIWGFESFEARLAIRQKASADGVWPPKDVPEHIVEAGSLLAFPDAVSPLC